MEYFHVVFTLPEPIATIAFYNKEVVYDILFHATAETLLTIARDPQRLGVEIGFFAVLHSWGQNRIFIRTCTAWFPAAACRRTTSAGFRAAAASFFPGSLHSLSGSAGQM